jgi:DNA-binding MarR family transcriptional regulator
MARLDWRDDEWIGAWSAMLRFHAAFVPVIDQELQRSAGMPLSWYDVLLELSASPGRRLRMSDLSEAVVLSRSRVSRVVDELAAVGYVARVRNPSDGRSAFTVLTDEGYAAFRKSAPIYLDLVRTRLGEALNARDAVQLRRLLEKALPVSRQDTTGAG